MLNPPSQSGGKKIWYAKRKKEKEAQDGNSQAQEAPEKKQT